MEKGDPGESGETGIAAAVWCCLEMLLMLVYLQVSHSQWPRLSETTLKNAAKSNLWVQISHY